MTSRLLPLNKLTLSLPRLNITVTHFLKTEQITPKNLKLDLTVKTGYTWFSHRIPDRKQESPVSRQMSRGSHGYKFPQRAFSNHQRTCGAVKRRRKTWITRSQGTKEACTYYCCRSEAVSRGLKEGALCNRPNKEVIDRSTGRFSSS